MNSLKRWLRRLFRPRDPETRDVRDLMTKFGIMWFDSPGHLTTRKALERHAFLQEELDEFKRAVDSQDLEEQVDALVDLVYVAKGTALMLGVDWDRHWEEVHRANLSKERGVTKRGAKVDLVKPPGWRPPDHYELLLAQGYEPWSWFTDEADVAMEHEFNEGAARDDN
jgi:predicted HAD superfamily Cof-like phosphohydrolase